MLLFITSIERRAKNHPFKVGQDSEREKLTESIRTIGAINPALARTPGLEAMPVVIWELTDDEAVITMVNANMQRETTLPSEETFACKMKLKALNHQGIICGQVGHMLRDAIS